MREAFNYTNNKHSPTRNIILVWGIMLLTALPGFSQNKQVIQIRTLDQNLKPVADVEVSVNGKAFTKVNAGGTAFLELREDDLPIKSVRINSEQIEVASWNYSKGIIEVIVREKNYLVLRLLVRDELGRPLRNTTVTFKGKNNLSVQTNGEGRCELPIPVDDKNYTINNFSVDNYRNLDLQIRGDETWLAVEKIAREAPKKNTTQEAAKDYFRDFDISRIDSIQSLTVFYAIFKNYNFKNMDAATRKKLDDKFNQLMSRMSDSVAVKGTDFMSSISDSSAVTDDIRNLLRQAEFEQQTLARQQAVFDEKVEILSTKMASGIQNMTSEERAAVLDELNQLEKILIQNESQFYKNQQYYRDIINSLKEKFFNLEQVSHQLSVSEAQRQEEQRAFRIKLILAASISVVFAILLVLLFSSRYKLKRQQEELVQANNEVKRINENLEDLVLERTRMLQQSNLELDTFMYRASHDLRSPICTIIGLCNVAGYSASPEVREILNKIVSTTSAMDRLLQKLAIISEVNNPKNYAAIPVMATLQHIADAFIQHADQHPAEFVLNCPADLTIHSYPGLIHAILFNLVENALQYSRLKDNHVRVELSASVENRNILFSVKDNGIGLDDNIRGRVFDMFYKGHVSSTGNGLGLYIVQRAVQALKGKITLETEPGLYTKFIIQLPLNGHSQPKMIEPVTAS